MCALTSVWPPSLKERDFMFDEVSVVVHNLFALTLGHWGIQQVQVPVWHPNITPLPLLAGAPILAILRLDRVLAYLTCVYRSLELCMSGRSKSPRFTVSMVHCLNSVECQPSVPFYTGWLSTALVIELLTGDFQTWTDVQTTSLSHVFCWVYSLWCYQVLSDWLEGFAALCHDW